ncbi:hypothetical protein [Streptomyces sp. CB03911]|uniref:hypothetical protein n=1 Tax=Streptomyces sp. CB03911 TaxID=1804758 RepID=UPI00093E6B2F|nr:hypothetical protein [Streptomyces sp. CB03911]OKI19291.1 hypothetical protein A6A07_07255 [Streptomyces sp. CB03911]
MSAFDDLVAYVVDATGYAPNWLTPEEAAAKLRPLLDRHAHELAELIRAEAADIVAVNSGATEACVLADEWDRAANLIDPNAEEEA